MLNGLAKLYADRLQKAIDDDDEGEALLPLMAEITECSVIEKDECDGYTLTFPDGSQLWETRLVWLED